MFLHLISRLLIVCSYFECDYCVSIKWKIFFFVFIFSHLRCECIEHTICKVRNVVVGGFHLGILFDLKQHNVCNIYTAKAEGC